MAGKLSRDEMHGCLGCVPCPLAELYSDYLRGLAKQ